MGENKRVCVEKPIRLIELFAGYGSQALAFKYLGVPIEHHFVCEFDKYAIASYNAVHGTDYPTIDIKDIHGKDLNITDTDKYEYILTYSFPCTDLSIAGKMAGMSRDSGTRSGLLWEVERLLKEIVADNGELPQILMMENVRQVISKSISKKTGRCNFDDFTEWLNFLESLGYTNTYQVLDAKDHGVPQHRERVFMFSFLNTEFGNNAEYSFPDPIPLRDKRMVSYLEKGEIDEKYYLTSDKAQQLIEQLVENGTVAGIIEETNKGNDIVSQVVGGVGEKKSNGNTQYYQQDRVYSMGDVALCHPASIPGGSYRYLEINENGD